MNTNNYIKDHNTMPTPTKKATPIPTTPTPPANVKPGKVALTPEQKEARAAALKAESKEDKLRRMAKTRVTKAVNDIRLIGNLAAYKPTDEQTDKIIEAVVMMTQAVEARLRGVKRDDKPFSI